MALTTRNLRDALERPPPPRPWAASKGDRMGYQPQPPRRPRSPPGTLVPPPPWIMRGENALLSLGAILLGGLVLLWLS